MGDKRSSVEEAISRIIGVAREFGDLSVTLTIEGNDFLLRGRLSGGQGASAAGAAQPKRRGRPPGSGKRRGRPAKAEKSVKAAGPDPVSEDRVIQALTNAGAAMSVKQLAGRLGVKEKKTLIPMLDRMSAEKKLQKVRSGTYKIPSPPKKRGRKPKTPKDAPAGSTPSEDKPKRKRGRPPGSGKKKAEKPARKAKGASRKAAKKAGGRGGSRGGKAKEPAREAKPPVEKRGEKKEAKKAASKPAGRARKASNPANDAPVAAGPAPEAQEKAEPAVMHAEASEQTAV